MDGEALSRGIESFNGGDYKTALDHFEGPYRRHRGAPLGDLYLGLVRAAAALHHFERGQPLSAIRLQASACRLLAGPAAAPAGFDRTALVADLAAVFAPLLAAPPRAREALRPQRRPCIRRLSSGSGE